MIAESKHAKYNKTNDKNHADQSDDDDDDEFEKVYADKKRVKKVAPPVEFNP